MIGKSLSWTISSYGLRWRRLYFHFLYPFFQHKNHLKPIYWFDWPIDLICYLADILLLPDILEVIMTMTKRNVRTLTDLEYSILDEVYGDTMSIDHIKIDSSARLFTKKYAFAYVSFNTINFWQSLSDEILVHEAMHVYQYQKYGSVYIYRALQGQHSKEGYDYGGISGLGLAKKEGKLLTAFNFEQQASIMEDYFQVTQRMDLMLMPGLRALYQHYRDQLCLA